MSGPEVIERAGAHTTKMPPRPEHFKEHCAITVAFSELKASLATVKGPVLEGLNAALSATENFTPGSLSIRPEGTSAGFAMGRFHIGFKDSASQDQTAYLSFGGGPNLIEVRVETPTHRSAFPLRTLAEVGQFLADAEKFSASNPGMVTKKSGHFCGSDFFKSKPA